MNPVTANLIMNPKPPTLYAILNSIANYDNPTKTKIRNLAKATHERIFDFDYDLATALDKEQFEIDILNHFMMRRIGFDTVTAFQLYLENKLHEILPYYNLMFDAFKDYKLFDSGEVIERVTVDNKNIDTSGHSDSESKYSEYPLNQLSDITDGTYVSNQTTVDSNVTNNSQEDNTTNENIKRSPVDKMSIYKTFLDTKRSVMSMIYKELDILFYGIGD